MADCDSWMGRRLWRIFKRSGLFEGKIYPYVLTSTEFDHSSVRDFEALVKRGMISREEYDRFLGDLQSLADKGEYFQAITTYIYVGKDKRR